MRRASEDLGRMKSAAGVNAFEDWHNMAANIMMVTATADDVALRMIILCQSGVTAEDLVNCGAAAVDGKCACCGLKRFIAIKGNFKQKVF